MSAYQNLLFEIEDGVARITLNRPDAANSFDSELARELHDAVVRCDEDPCVRAVLLSGQGRMFCAGGDIGSFVAAGDDLPQLIKHITVWLHGAIARLSRMEKPVVVAVNGPAAGAGFGLAMCGDLVLAGASAKFSMAYTGIGVSPDGGASYLLPRLVGLRRTQELMLSNRRLSADEALGWGLVTQVVADEALAEEAMKLARQMAQGPTRAYGVIKQLLLSSYDTGLETQMELEARGIAGMTGSTDGREGIAAFAEKRKPVFTGH